MMELGRLIVFGAVAGIPVASTFANVQCEVLADGASMPNYFSATFCHASGSFWSTDGKIIWAALSINGTVVKSWPDPRESPIIPRSLAAVFDSTHFADGSSIQIKIEAIDEWFHYGYAQASANAYNKGTVYGRNDFETQYSGGEGTGVVAEHLQACNYSIVANVNTLGWTANQILGHTTAPTAFYVNTHGAFDGNNPFFMSDQDEVGDPEYIYARFLTPQVLSVRQSAVGTGTPPRNSGNPPVTIAFVDACLTGQVNEFAAAFLWPYWTENGWCVDQSQVGWAIYTAVVATTKTQNKFWDTLRQGYTVDKARHEAVDEYKAVVQDPSLPYDIMRVWGDFATTLHGVYRGLNDGYASTSWYR